MRDLLSSRRLTFWTTLQLLWHLPTLARLLFRLVGDPQVKAGTKALFFGALLFILSPLDIPNFVPVLGEVSDAVLALLACRWFLNHCPVDLVGAHLAAIRGPAAGPTGDVPPAREREPTAFADGAPAPRAAAPVPAQHPPRPNVPSKEL